MSTGPRPGLADGGESRTKARKHVKRAEIAKRQRARGCYIMPVAFPHFRELRQTEYTAPFLAAVGVRRPSIAPVVNGVTTRFVQNCTLSRLVTSDSLFANDRLRMNWEVDGFRPDCPFKTLFQNRVQGQSPCEIDGVFLPFQAGYPYRTILYKSCGDPMIAWSSLRSRSQIARKASAVAVSWRFSGRPSSPGIYVAARNHNRSDVQSRTRWMASGRSHSWNGTPLRKAPGFRSRIGR